MSGGVGTGVRMSMAFPLELKLHLQEIAGPRNMTNWVLNAIYDKLEGKAQGALDPFEAKALEGQLRDARRLAQVLADAVASFDDDPNPQRVLQDRYLPDWLKQDSWPHHLKAEARPTRVIEVGTPDGLPVLERPADLPPYEELMNPVVEVVTAEEFEAEMGRPPAEVDYVEPKADEPEPIAPAPVERKDRTDLLARVQAKAQELGLTTASQVPTPERASVRPPSRATKEEVNAADMAVEPVNSAPPSTKCQSCGSDLVDGECWWC